MESTNINNSSTLDYSKTNESEDFSYNSRPLRTQTKSTRRILPKPDINTNKENINTHNNIITSLPNDNKLDNNLSSNSNIPRERWLRAFQSIKKRFPGVSC